MSNVNSMPAEINRLLPDRSLRMSETSFAELAVINDGSDRGSSQTIVIERFSYLLYSKISLRERIVNIQSSQVSDFPGKINCLERTNGWTIGIRRVTINKLTKEPYARTKLNGDLHLYTSWQVNKYSLLK